VQLRFAQADPRFHGLSSTSLVLLGGGGLGLGAGAGRHLASSFLTSDMRERYATGNLLLHALHNDKQLMRLLMRRRRAA